MDVVVKCFGTEELIVQIRWQGVLMTLNRSQTEPLSKFLVRLQIACGKHLGKANGGKKQPKKKKAKPGPDHVKPGQEDVNRPTGPEVRLLTSEGPVDDSELCRNALLRASHLEIAGERLPVHVNPKTVERVEVRSRIFAGCSLIPSVYVDAGDVSEFTVQWTLDGELLHEGLTCILPENATDRTLDLRAFHPDLPQYAVALPLGVVEACPWAEVGLWPVQRITEFGSRSDHNQSMRVVCFNILASVYARTALAINEMYPYCSAAALDEAYRQPLVGREIAALDGDIILLQEVMAPMFRKFLKPTLENTHEGFMVCKAGGVREGCALFLRREAFSVIERKDLHFREYMLAEPAFKQTLKEIRAKWPSFLDSILVKITTVFQLCVVRCTAGGRVLVIANTHLFFHPLARHVRTLQVMCLLHAAQELRQKHRAADGTLPEFIVAGDLNAAPNTAPVQLILEGVIESTHADWDYAFQFSWGKESAEEAVDLEAGNNKDEPTVEPDAKRQRHHLSDCAAQMEPLPADECQPGKGVSIQSATGALCNAYGDHPLPFTNYVHEFVETLDWIFHTKGLKSCRVLSGPSHSDLKPNGGLPCSLYPSDHIAIAADIELA